MQREQAQRPGAHLTEGWLGLLWCDMMLVLHAFLVSDGRTTQTRSRYSGSVSHLDEMGTRSVLIQGKFLGKWLTFKVPL